jgi:hypothetical protein
MLRSISSFLAASLLLISFRPYTAFGRTPAPNAPQSIRRHEKVVPGSYIVVLKDEAEGRVRALADQLARAHGGRVAATYERALRGFSAQMNEAAAEALAHNPAVDYVEEDGVVELAATQPNAPWGLDRIDQRPLPLSNTYTYANDGAGAHAYVIDSGIRTTHTEFGGRASVAFDNVGDTQNGQDCFGHGTQVSAVIGGSTYGVAKGVQLHAVRVFSCTNTSSLTKIIGGVDWVTTNHLSPAVALLSVSSGASTSLDTAVRNSISSGVTYAVAAGNLNLDAGTRSPSRVTEAITVGATDATDLRASFSNFGSVLDLFAPGVDVPTANWSSDTATTVESGTSLAAAHAAGVAARYLSGNPQETPAEVSASLTGNATQGAVIDPGAGSPNRLLYRPHGKIAFNRDVPNSDDLHVMNPDGTGQTNITNDTGYQMSYVWSPDGTKIAFENYAFGNPRIWVMNADGSSPTNLSENPSYPDAEDYAPKWSPNGTKIAFESYREGNPRIFVMNADGSNQTWITNTANDADPDWSPDGTKIVFTSYRDGNAEIYVMNADGSNQTRLTNNTAYDSDPVWSPAGTKIAFASSRVGN